MHKYNSCFVVIELNIGKWPGDEQSKIIMFYIIVQVGQYLCKHDIRSANLLCNRYVNASMLMNESHAIELGSSTLLTGFG